MTLDEPLTPLSLSFLVQKIRETIVHSSKAGGLCQRTSTCFLQRVTGASETISDIPVIAVTATATGTRCRWEVVVKTHDFVALGRRQTTGKAPDSEHFTSWATALSVRTPWLRAVPGNGKQMNLTVCRHGLTETGI